ncbi:MAG: hypothetical protein ABSD74_03985 [Rhizomicrobium sp.]|jgi:REP element-mobilizing transposase RayT
MARLGRYFIAGQPLHVIQRGNDRSFFTDDDARDLGGYLLRIGCRQYVTEAAIGQFPL